jgi:hypothetical protein
MNWKRIVVAKLYIALCVFAAAGLPTKAVWGQEDYRRLYTFDGGGVVSLAGDVNGDGYKDVIVGQPSASSGVPTSYVKIYSGKDGSNIHTIRDEGLFFGWSVAGAGDVDKDGFDDVIVGDFSSGPAGAVGPTGTAKVFSGKSWEIIYSLNGPVEGGSFGYTVSGAGDVNADGYDDFIVGSPSERNMAGSVRVYSGKDGTVLYLLAPQVPDPNLFSVADRFGNSVAGAGDVNKDGYHDFMVGAPYDSNEDIGHHDTFEGSARVFSGKDGSVIHTVWGHLITTPDGDQGSTLGNSVSAAGDVNRDGYPDFIAGAPNHDHGSTWPSFGPGEAFVFSGKDGALLHSFSGEKSEGEWEAQVQRFGDCVSGAGDVNGDQHDDVIVGAAGYKLSGRAQVFSGKDGALLYSFEGDIDTWTSVGYSVSGGGDVNGDGLADLVVASPNRPSVHPSRVVVFSDSCPNDPNKAVPGQCGCGIPDTDSDNDGTADCNENKPPTDITLSAKTIAENSGSNAVVGTFTTTDPDSGDTFTYTLVAGVGDVDNSAFNISGNTLRATNNFDFETKSSYKIRVRSSDREGLFVEKEFTIDVTDAEEVVTGTASNDAFIATYTGDGAAHRWLVTRGGSTVFNGPVASGIIIDGLAGNDTLQVVGRSVNDALALHASHVSVMGAVLRFPGVENLRLVGSGGNDTIALMGQPSTVTIIDGGAGTDRLESSSGNNTWTVTGAGAGNINGSPSFVAVETLVGGPDNDQFNFAAAGTVAGQVVGGSGVDTLNLSAKTTSQTVNLQTNAATSTGGIRDIDIIVGGSSATDTLIGPNTANSWIIDGANSGRLNAQALFDGFENITGGTGADAFIVEAGGSLGRVVNGGTGTDLLDLSAKVGTIEFRLGATPTITGIIGGYVGIERLVGNSSNDSKIVGTNANSTWSVGSNGQINIGSVNYLAVGTLVAGTGTDTLMGSALSNTWTLTAQNAGTLTAGQTGLMFSGMENLVGGSLADQFVFGAEGSLSGTINAGLGVDSLDFSQKAYCTRVWASAIPWIEGRGIGGVDLAGFIGVERVFGKLSESGEFCSVVLGPPNAPTLFRVSELGEIIVGTVAYSGFNSVEGLSGNDTIVGPSSKNKWSFCVKDSSAIVRGNMVFLETDSFVLTIYGIKNLTGGSMADDFYMFCLGMSEGGVLNGGDGEDTLHAGPWENSVQFRGVSFDQIRIGQTIQIEYSFSGVYSIEKINFNGRSG